MYNWLHNVQHQSNLNYTVIGFMFQETITTNVLHLPSTSKTTIELVNEQDLQLFM